MKRKLLSFLPVILSMSWSVAAVTPNAAVLLNDIPSSMDQEADLLTGFNRVDKYRISELEDLNSRLSEYDLVLVTSCANYSAERDFNDFGDAWRSYVAGGGTVLVMDANYPATSDLIAAPFQDQPKPFVWSSCQVSGESYSNGVVTDAHKVRLSEPASLDGYFLKMRSWQHFAEVPAGWESLIDCKHGFPMMLERQYGQGSVIVTTYYALFSIVGKEFMRDFAANLMLHRKWEQRKLEMTANEVTFDLDGFEWSGTVHSGAEEHPVLTARLLDESGAELQVQQLEFDSAGDAAFRFELPGMKEALVAVIESEDGSLPAYRRFHPAPDLSVHWHLPARLQPGQLSRMRLRLDNLLNRSFADAAVKVDGDTFPAVIGEDNVLRCDLSGLEPGEHEMTVLLDNLETASKNFTVTDTEMDITIDENGWLYRNGEEFFPIAFYHVSRAAGVTAENRMKCLEYAADNGYNLILMATIGNEEDDRFMAEAARRGIAVYCDVKTMDSIKDKRDEWPAVVSWMHELDEPEHWGYSREDVIQRARNIYELDPKGVLFSSMETTSTIVSYSGVTDLMATHGYPIPNDSLRLVYDKMSLLTSLAESYMFVPIGTVQSFGYPRPEDRSHGYPGLPTPQQIRNMTYQALLCNVHGIQFYTYADGAFLLDDYPELYECMRHIPEEIKFAVPFLRHGKFTRLDTGDREIEGGLWQMDGQELMVFVNLADTARELELNLPLDDFTPCFNSREVPVEGNVKMTPHEVIIWNRNNELEQE